jgi:predicted transcriptional regulator
MSYQLVFDIKASKELSDSFDWYEDQQDLLRIRKKSKFVEIKNCMSAATALDKEITHYLSHLNVKQKRTVLTVVKTFAGEQKDWWDEVSEEQQQAIDKALEEMKAGKLTPHAEVVKATGNG